MLCYILYFLIYPYQKRPKNIFLNKKTVVILKCMHHFKDFSVRLVSLVNACGRIYFIFLIFFRSFSVSENTFSVMSAVSVLGLSMLRLELIDENLVLLQNQNGLLLNLITAERKKAGEWEIMSMLNQHITKLAKLKNSNYQTQKYYK